MRRPSRPLTALLAPIVTLAVLACGQDTQSPTGSAEGELSPPVGVGPAMAVSGDPLQYSQVSAGGNHTCAVTLDGRAYCWGINFLGQLGDGTSGNTRNWPTPVATALRFRQISAGEFHTCAVTTDDLAYCWGDNGAGELGDKTTTPRTAPIKVLGGHKFRDVRVGYGFSCGVATTGESYCWGDNGFGEIGDNTIITRLVPRLVRGGQAFRRIVPGGQYACGVTTSDKAYCWGRNAWGQLGDGTTTDRHLPTAVAGNRSYKNVSGSQSHTCGFTTAGAVYCWGFNSDGELGDGTRTNRTRPVLAKTTGTLDGVSPGGSHSCALKSDGHALCWGSNVYGQVGDGTTIDPQPLPVLVVGPGNYDAIAAGRLHSCTLTNQHYAVCWGHNSYGQLGRGSYTQREAIPLGVGGPLE
jgi:alpha-tubulin suppressor-like RCC1 family protein